MTFSLSGFDGEYPAPASSCLALSGLGLSYPAAARPAWSKYLSKVGVTTPLWFAAGCCPPSPISAIWLRSIAVAIAWRTASLLVAACEGSRFGNRPTFSSGGDQVWLVADLAR